MSRPTDRTGERLDRALLPVVRVVADVRPGEVGPALALFANVFLILLAYYFVKPVREGWLSVSLVAGVSKIEIRAGSALLQMGLLVAVVRTYATLASRWARQVLLTRVTLFFASHLPLFWILQPGLLTDRVPLAGIAFYLWVGIFNVLVVAQFWAYAADVFEAGAGERLLPLVALGASSGAALGSGIADRLLGLEAIDSYDLLLVGALPLVASTALFRWTERRIAGTGPAGPGPATAPAAGTTGCPPRPFALLRSSRYLAAVAATTLLFAWVASNGDHALFGLVQAALEDGAAGAGLADAAAQAHVRDGTTRFYASLYLWINVCGMLLQGLVVSRILARGGFAVLFLILPILTALSSGTMALLPVLGVMRVLKVAEASTTYSVHNTARHVLWIPTSPNAKYVAKPAIDTVFVRVGDSLAAVGVLVGVRLLGASPRDFLLLSLVLAVAWIAGSVSVVRHHRALTGPGGPAPEASAGDEASGP